MLPATRLVKSLLLWLGQDMAVQTKAYCFFPPTPLCTGARTGVGLLVLKIVRVTG